MTYEQASETADGETHRCSSEELTANGFTVYEPEDLQAGVPGDAAQDAVTDAFLADAALETPEGCAGALRAIQREIEAEHAAAGA
jgi:hypothetical protein